MNDRLFVLRQRRIELLARIDAQRGQLAEFATSWKGQLALADRGMAIVRFLRAHPLLVAGVSAVVVVRNRRRLAGLASAALMIRKILRNYRYISGLLQKP